MNCVYCNVNKIGPTAPPCGGFMCGNEHMQCSECNNLMSGRCGICFRPTYFVHMKFNSMNPTPTAPLMSRSSMAYVFPPTATDNPIDTAHAVNLVEKPAIGDLRLEQNIVNEQYRKQQLQLEKQLRYDQQLQLNQNVEREHTQQKQQKNNQETELKINDQIGQDQQPLKTQDEQQKQQNEELRQQQREQQQQKDMREINTKIQQQFLQQLKQKEPDLQKQQQQDYKATLQQHPQHIKEAQKQNVQQQQQLQEAQTLQYEQWQHYVKHRLQPKPRQELKLQQNLEGLPQDFESQRQQEKLKQEKKQQRKQQKLRAQKKWKQVQQMKLKQQKELNVLNWQQQQQEFHLQKMKQEQTKQPISLQNQHPEQLQEFKEQHKHPKEPVAQVQQNANRQQIETCNHVMNGQPTCQQCIAIKCSERAQLQTLYFGGNLQNSGSVFGTACEPRLDCQSTETEAITTIPDYSIPSNKSIYTTSDSLNCSKGITEDDKNEETSDIRHTNSNESLHNYLSGGTIFPTSKLKEPEPGKKLLTPSEFDNKNSIKPIDLEGRFLHTSTNAHSQYPTYSINLCCYNGCEKCEKWTVAHQRKITFRDASASTESEPKLCKKKSLVKFEPLAKKNPSTTDFILLQATGVAQPQPNVIANIDKKEEPNIDQRMQRILETFQEDRRERKIEEKPLQERTKTFNKLDKSKLMSDYARPPLPAEKVETVGQKSIVDSCAAALVINRPNVISQLSNTQRALYKPPTAPIRRLHEQPVANAKEVEPQFELVANTTFMTNELVMIKSRHHEMNPLPYPDLQIIRVPIHCPDSVCDRVLFLSGLTEHIVVDHAYVPMERMLPGQCKNFLVDPRGAGDGILKCQILYLLCNKVTDLGGGKLKDFLPVIVMSARIGPQTMINRYDTNEYLALWLTGIVTVEFPVPVSLAVWSRSGPRPACHRVSTLQLYPVGKPQCLLNVIASGNAMLLSIQEVNLLTKNGKEMLEVQILVQ